MAKETQINYSKKNEETGEEFNGTVTMNFPENLDEAVKMWGENVILGKALAQITIDARRLCYTAESPEQAQTMVSEWTPGVNRVRSASGVSKKAMLALLSEMSEDEIKELVASRKAKAQA